MHPAPASEVPSGRFPQLTRRPGATGGRARTISARQTSPGLVRASDPSSGGSVGGDGSGQTIALIEAYHDPYLASDLHTFDRTYGLPDAKLTVVNQAGSRTDNDWAAEETLDVEWAHAIAPGANLMVVEAASQSVPDLMAAVNTARNTPGVVAVSMSWGYGELPNETSYDSYFTTPAGHQGVSFIASAGDFGNYPEYPGMSPNVLSVGGTTLPPDAAGNPARAREYCAPANSR